MWLHHLLWHHYIYNHALLYKETVWTSYLDLLASTAICRVENIISSRPVADVYTSTRAMAHRSHGFLWTFSNREILASSHWRLPLWPQANSEAENFMKPLTKAVRSSHVNGRNWKKQQGSHQQSCYSIDGLRPSYHRSLLELRQKMTW